MIGLGPDGKHEIGVIAEGVGAVVLTPLVDRSHQTTAAGDSAAANASAHASGGHS